MPIVPEAVPAKSFHLKLPYRFLARLTGYDHRLVTKVGKPSVFFTTTTIRVAGQPKNTLIGEETFGDAYYSTGVEDEETSPTKEWLRQHRDFNQGLITEEELKRELYVEETNRAGKVIDSWKLEGVCITAVHYDSLNGLVDNPQQEHLTLSFDRFIQL